MPRVRLGVELGRNRVRHRLHGLLVPTIPEAQLVGANLPTKELFSVGVVPGPVLAQARNLDPLLEEPLRVEALHPCGQRERTGEVTLHERQLRPLKHRHPRLDHPRERAIVSDGVARAPLRASEARGLQSTGIARLAPLARCEGQDVAGLAAAAGAALGGAVHGDLVLTLADHIVALREVAACRHCPILAIRVRHTRCENRSERLLLHGQIVRTADCQGACKLQCS
mmetsp:Transcript_23278/g.67373  ORF Transcript_23278/g.67373 Transcript_23278/m.67373 type:complete len:226 (+) Transcript_23278:4669-5346(+)